MLRRGHVFQKNSDISRARKKVQKMTKTRRYIDFWKTLFFTKSRKITFFETARLWLGRIYLLASQKFFSSVYALCPRDFLKKVIFSIFNVAQKRVFWFFYFAFFAHFSTRPRTRYLINAFWKTQNRLPEHKKSRFCEIFFRFLTKVKLQPKVLEIFCVIFFSWRRWGPKRAFLLLRSTGLTAGFWVFFKNAKKRYLKTPHFEITREKAFLGKKRSFWGRFLEAFVWFTAEKY